MLSFTQYTQSVSLGKCSTIASNRFNRLSLNIMRGSNSCLPSALRPTGGDSYVVYMAYVVRQLSLFKSDFPKVVNSCSPTIMNLQDPKYVMLMMKTNGTLDNLEGSDTHQRYKGTGGELVTKLLNYREVFGNHFNYRHKVDNNNNQRHSPISVERAYATRYWTDQCHS